MLKLLSKVLKELNELTAVRIRSPDQQKILQQLTAARQKLLSMQNNKSIGNRAKQNQYQVYFIDFCTVCHSCKI